MTRGEVFIDSQEVQVVEGVPPQYQLVVTGSLPTPCHELRAVVDVPDEQDQIDVQLFSLVDPSVMCIQVLEAFEATIPLGSFPSNSYTVWVNGEAAGEMTP